ncbi:hypothetical protein V2J09_005015 [Rumex salicifolius]
MWCRGSSTAKIRSEVLSPFRTVRMFFYLAFIASGGLGGLIAGAQLISALTNPSRAADVSTILNGFGIDIGAVALFAFLYSRDNKAKNAQEARLSREEVLSDLKVRVDDKRIIPLSSFRGIGRLVILAGSPSFIAESFELSEPFTERLLERGVLVVPLVMNGQMPIFVFDESEEAKDLTAKRKRLWQLLPVYVAEWKGWLDEQKKMANVAPDSPVYMSLRLDGRVRGSGVGYPPWNAFVAQLPPVQGIWSGLLDGMDGRDKQKSAVPEENILTVGSEAYWVQLEGAWEVGPDPRRGRWQTPELGWKPPHRLPGQPALRGHVTQGEGSTF